MEVLQNKKPTKKVYKRKEVGKRSYRVKVSASASKNKKYTFSNFSDSPLHLLIRVDTQILKKLAPDSDAAADANNVFPVPEKLL